MLSNEYQWSTSDDATAENFRLYNLQGLLIGLKAIHEQGWLHRGILPHRVQVCSFGSYAVFTDFDTLLSLPYNQEHHGQHLELPSRSFGRRV